MPFRKPRLGGFYYPRNYPTRMVWLVKSKFKIKALYRWFRVLKVTTKAIGYQYSPSNDLIEIDITYQCNLRCINCNRSSAQAPEAKHISVGLVKDFVAESIEKKRFWRRIRVLGGEPTLHPDFHEIIEELSKLQHHGLADVIQLVTNGFGPKVAKVLASLPANIDIENSTKNNNIQPTFGPFNSAPCDDAKYRYSNFKNGCEIMHSCGLGLTPQGYYPCAVAGGIDRVTKAGIGRKHLPELNDDMRDLLERNCKLCGRFRDGHYVPEKLRPKLLNQVTSPSWTKIYQNWQQNR